jgi:glutaredoxin
MVEELKENEGVVANTEPVISKESKKINYWMISSIVLGILSLVLLVILIGGGMTGNVVAGEIVSADVAGENFQKFADSVGVELEVLSVEETDNFYEIRALVEGDVEVFPVTKDGKFLSSGIIPLTEPIVSEEPSTPSQQPTQSQYSEEELVELKKFNECLATKGFVIYGSNTCPHCRDLVQLLGGYETAASVYVECSENRERCNDEAITGYVPEIQIDGQLYEGQRNLESFSQETGCSL